MKYAFITAALAAASLATTVNIDVEGAEVAAADNMNNRHSRHSVGRHHRDHRGHNRGNWWTDLFSRGGRNDRNDNRQGREDRDRNGQRIQDLDDLLEDLFEVNFKCTREARDAEWSHSEWQDCYRRRAEDINEDLKDRDDAIFGTDDEDSEESDRRGRRGRNDRNNGRNRRDRRGRHGRDHRRSREQMAMEGGGNDDDRREYECSVEMNDPLRRDQIMRECCEQEQLGHFEPLQGLCIIEGRQDRDAFRRCAMEEGAYDTDCRREEN